MTVCEILLFPEHSEALRKKSTPVHQVDESVKNLIKDIKDTLREYPDSIGLAAPQINVHKRVVIVRLGAMGSGSGQLGLPFVLINPKIVLVGEEGKEIDGCLSFLGVSGNTIRPHHLRVIGLDEYGEPFDRIFNGYDAVVVHHEIDHLDGVLFNDRVESLDDISQFRIKENGELVRVPV